LQQSYTTFEISKPTLSTAVLWASSEHSAVQASVTVKNTGTVGGDEVVFLFKKSQAPALAWHHRSQGPAAAPPALPARELIGFGRVTLAPGASAVVSFNTSAAKMSSVDEFGTRSGGFGILMPAPQHSHASCAQKAGVSSDAVASPLIVHQHC
jgi:hypothetical protein